MARHISVCLAAALLAAVAPAGAEDEIRIDGPAIPLGGAMILPEGAGRIVVIVPGSGPTDRDGNSPGPLRTDAYKLLAQALAQAGIATIRTDKRGMFSSADTAQDPNDVTVAAYAADIRAWSAAAARRAGTDCAWILGHSEGGVMALAAARGAPPAICGLILVATPGRPLGQLLREQLKANPANRRILDGALAAIDALERGEHVDLPIWEFTLRRLFHRPVQDYLIDLFAHDPAAMIAGVRVPVLIVQGTRDLQVAEDDALALKSAQPGASLALIEDMNHVLKVVASSSRGANARTYGDPLLPLSPALMPAILDFLAGQPR